jgi:putative flippase GtrA
VAVEQANIGARRARPAIQIFQQKHQSERLRLRSFRPILPHRNAQPNMRQGSFSPDGPMRRLISQFAKFGAIGAIGYVVNVALFNLLRSTVFEPSHVHGGELWAEVCATLVAIIVNWIGNRYWTFRKEARRHPLSEAVEFFAVSLVGLGIQTGCLWISHYALGYTSQLADNISANVIGLALGTVFRFALYRLWVFNPSRKSVRAHPANVIDATVAAAADLGTTEVPVQPAS